MVRVTRSPSRPKPKFLHECKVGREEAAQPWLWQQVESIAGPSGYKKRTPFWACTIIAFDTKEKAEALELYLRRRREVAERLERRTWPCPVAAKYDEAAKAQHAVIWGLSTGIIRDVVRTYRRERRQCSSHGHPNWKAADVILAAAPSIGRDRAREMVDAMLAWTIARHGNWFWKGLAGARLINRY